MSESAPQPPRRFPLGWVVGSVLWVIVFAVLFFGPRKQPDNNEQTAQENEYEVVPLASQPADDITLEPIVVPEFQLISQEGQPIKREDLLGKPWVASFIFTNCAGPCTNLTKTVMELNAATKDADVKFVSFTVDPARDTPERLTQYAEMFAAKPDRWLFLTGEKSAIYDLIRNTFQLVVEEEPTSSARLGFEFAHSTRLIHIDAEGKIAGSYKGEDPAEIAILRRVLLGQTQTPRQNQFFRVVPKDKPPAEEQKTSNLLKSPEAISHDEVIIRGQDSGENPPPVTATEPPASQPPAAAPPAKVLPDWIARLPVTNAVLNSLATILLMAGYIAIKTKHAHTHRNLMISAFVVSVLFLGCYLTYHFGMQYYLGDASKKFTGTGWIRPVYYVILLTHVLLAMAVPVLALMTFYRAFRAQWDKHKRIAKITFPIWLYVSVTGVVIYGMLYHWPTAVAG